MVDAVQTWTPYLWPSFLLHPPVWYQHILMDTKDNPAGCACSLFPREELPSSVLGGRKHPPYPHVAFALIPG